MLKNCMGEQAKKIADIPGDLDQIVGLIGTDHGGTKEQPHIIEKNIEFTLPDGWEHQFSREMRRLEKKLNRNQSEGGTWTGFLGVIVLVILFLIIAL